jgi:tetratricopeptide (TPR) repeat protein
MDHPSHARARALFNDDRFADALAAFDEALAVEPGRAALYADRAWCLAELGRHDDAIADARRAVAIAPADGYTHTALLRVLEIADRFEDLVAVFDTARTVAASPAQRAAQLGFVSYALLRCDNYVDAFARATEGIALAPSARLYCDQAMALAATNWLAEAREAIAKAVELSDTEFYRDKQDLIEGFYRTAVEGLAAAQAELAQDPGRASAWTAAGTYMTQLGRVDEGFRAIARGLELGDGWAEVAMFKATVQCMRRGIEPPVLPSEVKNRRPARSKRTTRRPAQPKPARPKPAKT